MGAHRQEAHPALAACPLHPTCVHPRCRAEDDAEVDSDEDDEDEERAVLLIRRVVADERPLEGKQTTVTISIYNAGKA